MAGVVAVGATGDCADRRVVRGLLPRWRTRKQSGRPGCNVRPQRRGGSPVAKN